MDYVFGLKIVEIFTTVEDDGASYLAPVRPSSATDRCRAGCLAWASALAKRCSEFVNSSHSHGTVGFLPGMSWRNLESCLDHQSASVRAAKRNSARLAPDDGRLGHLRGSDSFAFHLP